MRILITGGLGYIGSHLICKLIQQNHQIHIIDDLSNTELKVLNNICELTHRPDLIRFYHISLLDQEKLSQIFIDNDIFDICFHLAQNLSVDDSIDFPLNIYKKNIISTLNLLDCIKKNHCKKIIHLSNANVYSIHKSNVSETDFRGQDLKNPLNRSIYFQEEILQDFSINTDNKVITLEYKMYLVNIFLKLKHPIKNLFHHILKITKMIIN